MKILLLLLALAFVSIVQAQDLPVKDGKVFYEQVDSASDNKNVLYSNAKRWIATTFNDAKTVIELDDKEGGEIVGKCGVIVNWFPLGAVQRTDRCRLTFQINIKDNKYRIQLYNLSIQELNGNSNRPIEDYKNKGVGKKLLPVVDKNVSELMESFKTAMATPADTDF